MQELLLDVGVLVREECFGTSGGWGVDGEFSMSWGNSVGSFQQLSALNGKRQQSKTQKHLNETYVKRLRFQDFFKIDRTLFDSPSYSINSSLQEDGTLKMAPKQAGKEGEQEAALRQPEGGGSLVVVGNKLRLTTLTIQFKIFEHNHVQVSQR